MTRLNQQSYAFRAALIVIIAVSTALSYLGIASSFEPTLEGKIQASILAVGVFACLYLYNNFVIEALNSNVPITNRLAVLCFALMFSVFVVMLSTATSVAGIAGTGAQNNNLQGIEQNASRVTTKIYQRAKAVRKFHPIFENSKNAWSQAAEHEAKSGAYSNFPGAKGATHSTLHNYSLSFEQLDSELGKFLASIEELKKLADKELQAIRQAIETANSPEQAMKDIAKHLDTLNAILTTMNGNDLIDGFRITVVNFPNALKAITLSKNPNIRRGQQHAIDKIELRLKDNINLLIEEFDKYQAEPVLDIPKLEPMNSLRAVIKYYHLYIQAFAASFALDFLGIFVAVVRMVLNAGKSEAEKINKKRMETPVGELINLEIIKKQLMNVPRVSGELEKKNKQYLGLDDDKTRAADKKREEQSDE